jgi:hypothetical protein
MCSPLAARETELLDGRGGVGKEPRLVRRIDPCTRDDPGAVARADLGLAGVDQLVERPGIDEPFLGQQRLQRLDAKLGLGQRGSVCIVVIVMVVGHRVSSSCRDRHIVV